MAHLDYVYILSNKYHSVLYTGISNNLERRTIEHRSKQIPGFTAKYNVNKLLYYEIFSTPMEAIAAEKRIKKWPIRRKRALIRSKNPSFVDLYPEITA